MDLLSSPVSVAIYITDLFTLVFCSVLQWTNQDQKLLLRALYGYTRKGLSIGM